jgi:plastocyanin
MRGYFMFKKNRGGWANHRLFGLCAALALGLVLLSACGGGKSNTGSTGITNTGDTSNANNSASNANSSNGASSSSSTGSSAACDQITKVSIAEHSMANKEDQYTFSPDHVTIKTGQFIAFDNQSDEIHVLVATPDAALANSAIDRNENQPVQFTKAGTYTLESQDAKHRGTMQVTVMPATGTTCGMSAPEATVTFTGKHTQGQANPYEITPQTVSLKVGQSIALLNKTDQALNFSCKPSADMAEGNLRVDMNEQQVIPFNKTGQYTCTSTESPSQKVTVTVH